MIDTRIVQGSPVKYTYQLEILLPIHVFFYSGKDKYSSAFGDIA